MSIRATIPISLWVRSPFAFRAVAGARLGFDAPILRENDRPDGPPIIPGDQIRGVLAEALRDLGKATGQFGHSDLLGLFGRPSSGELGEGSREPLRGQLLAGDLTATAWRKDPEADKKSAEGAIVDWSKETPTSTVTRIAIDAETGAVATGALQVVELALPPGAAARFDGTLVLFNADAETWAKRIHAALGLVSSIGAFKSAGFGEVLSVRVDDPKKDEFERLDSIKAALPAGPRIAYDVIFDRPVLFDAEKVADNADLGAEIIPGAAFKGALAQRLKLLGEHPERGHLADVLAALHVSHAFPLASNERPANLPVPLSVVAAKGTGDSLLVADALLARGEGSPLDRGVMIADGNERRVPVFRPDWKDTVWKGVLDYLRWPGVHLRKVPRTHVRINIPLDREELHAPEAAGSDQRDAVGDERREIRDRGRGTGMPGQLFTNVARAHRHEDGTNVTWRFELDLAAARAIDTKLCDQIVGLLEKGLDGMGRTSATAKLSRVPVRVPEPAPVHGRPGQYALVLRTRALLLDGKALVNPTTLDWAKSAAEAYRDYFREALGAELVDYYAEQRWAGGYVGLRFKPYGAETYHPFLVTMPGSVFLLENPSIDRLNEVARLGLPPAKLNGKDTDWRTNPFVRENGYGAVDADWLADPDMAKKLKGAVHV